MNPVIKPGDPRMDGVRTVADYESALARKNEWIKERERQLAECMKHGQALANYFRQERIPELKHTAQALEYFNAHK